MAAHIKLDVRERSDRTEAVFDTIEAAIKFEEDMDEVVPLPEGLSDPVGLMKRVRALLDREIGAAVGQPLAPAPNRGLVELANTMSGELHHFFEAYAPNLITTRYMWCELCDRLEHHERTNERFSDAQAHVLRVATAVAVKWIPPRQSPLSDGPMRSARPAEVLSQTQRRLRKLDRLSPRRKLAWILSKEVGLHHREIAPVMGIEPGTVDAHIRDAGRMLHARAEQLESARDRECYPNRKVVRDLARVNWSFVRMTACQVTRNVTVSYDIAQTVCLRLLALPRERLEAIECLEVFAARAARSEARNWRRVNSRHVSATPLTGLPADEHCDPAFVVGNENEALHALAKLSEWDRAPFILCKVFGYSSEEAAEALGIRVEAVLKHIQKALKTWVRAGLRPSSPRRLRIRSLFNPEEP